MSVEPRTLKTEAEAGLAEHWRQNGGSLPGSFPAYCEYFE